MRSGSSAVNDVIYSNYITLSSGTLWNISRATFFFWVLYTREPLGKSKHKTFHG